MYYDSELLASVAGLGSSKSDKKDGAYIKGPKCQDSLQEIQRLWRRQSDDIRDVFYALGTWNTLTKDLIPILLNYRNEPKTIFATCKLLVMITMPPPANSSNIAQQWEILQGYKEAFLGKEVLAAVLSVLAEPLSQNASSRTEEDSQLIELVLTLFRNLLHIPDPITTRAVSDTRENMHDSLILAYQKDHILELLIIVAGMLEEKNNKGWDVLLLEIFYLILRKETPDGLLDAHIQDQAAKRNGHANGKANGHANGAKGSPNGKPAAGTSKLSQLMAKEKQSAKARAVANPVRHAKFNGVFVTTQLTGGQKVINNPVELASPVLSGKSVKVRGASGSAKAPLPNEHYVRSSTELKLALKSFVDQVLAECYNTLMRSLKSDFERETEKLIETDISNYLWLVKFFTGYHCLSQKMDIAKISTDEDEPIDVTLVSATMDMLSFKSLILKCETALEHKKWNLLDTSVGAITEMANMLHLMSERGGSKMRNVALTLQSNIFYDRTLFLDKVVHFVRTFDAGKHPRTLLVKLVELVHVTLEMLEGNNHIYVAKRVAKNPKDKKASTEPAENGTEKEKGDNPDKGKEAPSTVPGEGVADASKPDQPNAEPGSSDPNASEKAPSEGASKPDVEMNGAEPSTKETPNAPNENGEPAKDSEKDAADKAEAEAEAQEAVRETRLNFQAYLNSFAHNAVISNYTYLLKNYKDNRQVTNHQIISLFDSIAVKCGFKTMFYQLSVFVVFDKLLSDPVLRSDAQYKEIYTFINMIVDNFFLAAETNKFLFAAVLFWKTKHDCLLMNAATDYDSEDGEYENDFVVDDNAPDKPEAQKMAEWIPADDERLKSYFNQYKDSSSAIDLVMASMGATRTSAEVYKRLDQLGVLTTAHRNMFADIAKEAEFIDTPHKKPANPANQGTDKRSICQKLASASGRGPLALAFIQAKVEEAALLRERFELEGSENNYPMPNYDIVPVNAEEEKYIACCAKLLTLFGFVPPRKGQQSFWRIPATKKFVASSLKTRIVELISQCLKYAALVKSKAKKAQKKRKTRNHDWSGSESENEYESESEGEEEEASKENDDEGAVHIEEPSAEPREDGPEAAEKRKKSSESESKKSSKKDKKEKEKEKEKEKAKKEKKNKKKDKKRDEPESGNDEEPSEKTPKKKSRKSKSEDSDEEEEVEKTTKKSKKTKRAEEETKKKKKVRIAEDSDSDSKNRKQKGKSNNKRKGDEEDEELEAHTPVKKRLRKNVGVEESEDIAPPLSPPTDTPAEEASVDIAEPLSLPASLPTSASEEDLDDIFEAPSLPATSASASVDVMEARDEEEEEESVVVRNPKHKIRIVARVDSDEEDE